MRHVNRGLTLLSALLATLAVAMPAAAAEAATLKGVLVAVTPNALSVKDSKGVVTTCARAAKSPSLDGYAAGDRVQAACARIAGTLVLAKIRRLTAPSGAPANDAEPTTFGGAITSLTGAAISVHVGDRDLTCSIGSSSPSTANAKVGQHVTIACANGVLVAIAPTTPGRAYEGTVSAVSSTSITVHTAHGDGTCTVGDGSPSTAGVKPGDRVLAGCKAGTNQLELLKKLAASPDAQAAAPTPPAPPSPTGDAHTVTVAGTLSALSSSSVTVHGEHGDVSCTVPATARLGDFHVGDRVGMACADGALLKLLKL
jgi:hypothetical protein